MMSRYCYVLVLACLMFSCGTQKKAIDTEVHNSDSSAVYIREKTDSSYIVDTTKLTSGTITITEVEFFPADAIDSVLHSSVTIGERDVKMKSTSRVKSIRQTVISRQSEERGLTAQRDSAEKESSEVRQVVSDEAVKVEEVPVPSPNRWRYIYYICLIAVVASLILYLKRVPILNWIRMVLSSLRKIF